MGARASRRRHEGRRIRKQRRILGSTERKIDEVAEGLTAFGKAAEKAARGMTSMFRAFSLGIPGVIAARDERDGSVTLAVDPAPPHPTQSGVEDGREALSVPERVDAAAARMGIELAPWQRDLAIITLSGIPLQVQRPQAHGKTTVGEVVKIAHRQGCEARRGWVDEAAGLA